MLSAKKIGSELKKSVNNFYSHLQKIPLKIWIGLLFFIAIILYALNYITPNSITFTYNQTEYCTSKYILFPGLYKQANNKTDFQINVSGGIKINNFYLLSDKICIKPITPPDSGQNNIGYSLFGSIFFNNNYTINVNQRPKVITKINQPTALTKPIDFTLDQPDKIFEYKLAINNKIIDCKNTSSKISCDVSIANLKQGGEYEYKLSRFFNGSKVSDVTTSKLNLLPPVVIVKSSIQNNEIVYSKPKTFVIEMNKKITKANIVLEKNENNQFTKLDLTNLIDNTTITTSFNDDLARKTSYRLTVNTADGEDGSILDSAQVINFQTSGGPTVTGVNIGKSGIDPNAFIAVTFDQPISQTQDINKFVSFSGGNVTIGRTDNQITFQLHNLNRCQALSLNIAKGLSNKYDVMSDNSWSYTSQTNCRVATKVIGYSVKGRSIMAYFYGNGPTTILFTGGIHGNEHSGEYFLRDWVSYLDTYAYKIPAGRQIVIVPNVNPDGLASSSRYNANNVNIDRNFPTANWSANIDSSSGIVVNGGGPAPLSEPETRALANLTASLQPRLEISYHSQGSLVGANQYGDSVSIGNIYATRVGYVSMIGQAEQVMGYSITGEYEDWMGEQLNVPAILIELPTNNGYYFQYHQSVLWQMVGM